MAVILLQAMMALPFALVIIMLPVSMVVYTLLRLYDKITGKRKHFTPQQLVKRRSVHLLLALAAGIITVAYFIYLWSLPGAGMYT